ncbi:hypothetical protein BABINDRAFT_61952 [Babjeviella inositovora NRRL Y-12698]|uniref:Peptidyl-prolyl cis-trans isomerase n=1 Tax=Babjeviella inositovora NRRL Y-12698 TaxID=984486 RepID=A0A1E3QQ04_9ASCO|nr:uncharacterized protein BABINDRAFT_61952 [Babjeviella inositovora NRRL Y-12698]ODQ79740.1 hypothetical protein BABINDRAFT_61952 [Babjeviella inositovora NRRL Y-12698]
MSTGLPSGWSIRTSRTHNQEYYYNDETKESSWEAPSGTDIVQLKAYLLATYATPPDKVRCNHLLIKYAGSRRPSSWKEENITRTREEAIKILRDWQAKLKRGEAKSLSEIAQTESDCSSHSQGGDLGAFGKGQMQPSFEKAAFKLNVGDISDIVESDSGFHLIERVA